MPGSTRILTTRPVTGEGIYYALRSAELFAESYLEGRPLDYERRWREDFGGELRRAAEMRRRFYGNFWGAPFTERMIELGRAHRGIRRVLREANLSVHDVDAVAATAGPGLIGGVMVGTIAILLPFGVWFGLLARMSVFERRRDGTLVLRPPAVAAAGIPVGYEQINQQIRVTVGGNPNRCHHRSPRARRMPQRRGGTTQRSRRRDRDHGSRRPPPRGPRPRG